VVSLVFSLSSPSCGLSCYQSVSRSSVWEQPLRHVHGSDILSQRVEFRRRTRPIGSLTNADSLNRIAYGIFSIISRMWEDTCLSQFTQNS
jgi:hypothetical protein